MVRQSKSGSAHGKKGSATLMARLVDRSDVAIRPADVRSVEFSLYELEPCWPELLMVAGGQCNVPLPVDEVLFDTLQRGGRWSLDDVGYNFRHEIQPGHSRAFPKDGVDYELEYRFTTRSGQTIAVRFRLPSRVEHRESSIEGRGDYNDRR